MDFVSNFEITFTVLCLFTMNANGCVYETFGISKHFPVKLQLLLKRAEMFHNALTAKCFIYDVCALHEQRTPTSKLYK